MQGFVSSLIIGGGGGGGVGGVGASGPPSSYSTAARLQTGIQNDYCMYRNPLAHAARVNNVCNINVSVYMHVYGLYIAVCMYSICMIH